ncbi:MAG: V-type ATPase subunit [Evtepia sp.]|uniref:V-type ATPase subunit n=1 Tax=Evtepia sp. TaxID=2773933 RepID=UPI002A763645|nr:V-type ATPase subunit [Evtepia sp.]MDY3013951.1 V-type ATPase subunit [Evtepia sp.]
MTGKIRDTDYLFLTTRVRSLECSLLDQNQMEQMLESASVEDAARILTDCGYPELEKVNGDTVSRMLIEEQERMLQDVGQFVPDPALLAVFQMKHDYHNVKVLLKAEAMGTEADYLMVGGGRVDRDVLSAAVQSGDFRNLPPLLGEAVEQARQTLSASRDPQLGDFVLDEFYFREMMALADGMGSRFLEGYVQRTIDLANLRTVVRVQRMGRGSEFLEGILFAGGTMETGRILSAVNAGAMLEELYASTPLQKAAEAGAAAIRGEILTLFEKLCDEAVLDYARQAQFVGFGEAPVIAYLAAKEAEITAVRIIMTGRLAGLPTDVIRERMREAYV